MPPVWLPIVSSTMIHSFCCQHFDHTLAKGLEGTDYWYAWHTHIHGFILDLLQEYTISKVRGRSFNSMDPVLVDIYISNDIENWGAPVLTDIAGWQDRTSWLEIDIPTPKNGRYIKPLIKASEFGPATYMMWGKWNSPYMRMFEPFVAPPTAPYPTGLLKKGFPSGYHCFMSAYILAKIGGYDPLKLPDGTTF